MPTKQQADNYHRRAAEIIRGIGDGHIQNTIINRLPDEQIAATEEQVETPAEPTTVAEDIETARESQGIVARGQAGKFLTRQAALEELSTEEKSYQDSLYRSGQTADAACIAGLKLVKALKEQVRQAKLQPGKWIDLAAARGELAAAQAKESRNERGRKQRDQGVAREVENVYRRHGLIS